MQNQFIDYKISISTEPSYYGADCYQYNGTTIIAEMARSKFPGIQTDTWCDGRGSGETTGPDEEVVDEINAWIRAELFRLVDPRSQR